MKIRTLGFYSPFGSLMLHDKLETRWVREGKRPPFPVGKYLFYHTKQSCNNTVLINWCGIEIKNKINRILVNEPTKLFHRMAIGIGDLVEVRPMTKQDEELAFVKFVGTKTQTTDGFITHIKIQWVLKFDNVQRIQPFSFLDGKQGVGILSEDLHYKIKTLY